MNDPEALNQAYKLLWAWAAGSIVLFMAMQFGIRHEWVDIVDVAAPALLTFGFSHVCLGLCILARTRASHIKYAPRPNGPLFHLSIAGHAIGSAITIVGVLVLYHTISAILVGPEGTNP